MDKENQRLGDTHGERKMWVDGGDLERPRSGWTRGTHRKDGQWGWTKWVDKGDRQKKTGDGMAEEDGQFG